ncbi:MAG: CPBP family intramembrane glutamic endopeptidase [Myxococcaceae bacterium]
MNGWPFAPGENSEGAGRSREHERRIELAVFLFLIVPTLLLSFVHREGGHPSFPLLAVSVIARDLALVSLIIFFLWRNQEPLQRIGWAFNRKLREVGLGILLFVPLEAGTAGLELTLRRLGLSVPTHPPSELQPSGVSQLVLGLVLVLVVGIAEETIFRGYLLLRLKSWTRNMAVVVVGSSVIFAIGHGYEGSAGVVTVGVMGAALALIYLWRRSLVASITLHFLVDFSSIVLAPALGST